MNKYWANISVILKNNFLYVSQEYKHELEKSFNNFSDLAHTFPLFRGKGQQSVEDTNSVAVGYFKVHVNLHNLVIHH